MRMAQLSLQQTPALQVPIGFFLVAPWFGIGAGVLLILAGPSAWTSRWTPDLLAAAHLLLLGCVVMVMMGALVQVLPVISSARVPAIERTAAWIRGSLGAGAAILAAALKFDSRPLFLVAGALLLAAFGLYLLPLVPVLLRRVGGGDAMVTIRLALLCLLVTVGLGLYLAAAHVSPDRLANFRSHTHTHLGFGLVGWMLLLIMAVSFQVLPMFHVAPDYPRWVTRGVPIAIVAGLTLDFTWLIAAACLAYGVMTLSVLHRRKRRAPDTTVQFWRAAAVCLVLLAVASVIVPAAELPLGVGFVAGTVLTVLIGMQYKIVPFLVFLHLQRSCMQDAVDIARRAALVPTMHDILPPARGRTQWAIHLVTIALAVAATIQPQLGPVVGLGLVADFSWLWGSVRIGWRRYRVTAAQLAN